MAGLTELDTVRRLQDLCEDLASISPGDVRPSMVDELSVLSDTVYEYLQHQDLPAALDDIGPLGDRDYLQSLVDRSYQILDRLLP